MPFDGKDFDVETDIYTLRRRKLCDALRGEMRGWDWDFTSVTNTYESPQCGTAGCAIGLAIKMWPEAILTTNYTKLYRLQIAEFLGMTARQSEGCFADDLAQEYGIEMEHVTPAMVADKIEELCGK